MNSSRACERAVAEKDRPVQPVVVALKRSSWSRFCPPGSRLLAGPVSARHFQVTRANPTTKIVIAAATAAANAGPRRRQRQSCSATVARRPIGRSARIAQVVGQGVGGSVPCGWLLRQALQHDRFEVADRGSNCSGPRVVQHLLDQLARFAASNAGRSVSISYSVTCA